MAALLSIYTWPLIQLFWDVWIYLERDESFSYMEIHLFQTGEPTESLLAATSLLSSFPVSKNPNPTQAKTQIVFSSKNIR